MGISRFVRCDSCEHFEPLLEDVDPTEIGWLQTIYGMGEEDSAYFCRLQCQIRWSSSDETRSLLEELAEHLSEDEGDSE